MFTENKINGIKFFTSSVLRDNNFVHAFSTRIGGATPFPMNSFTMGSAGIKDFEEEALNNRKKLCDILGCDYSNIIVPEQKHTDNIAVVKSLGSTFFPDTDGVITNLENIPILMQFADCTPIILYSSEKNTFGVVHAGWRGSAKGIVKKAVNIFNKEFGVDSRGIKAAIGPAIGACCYPVSKDVADLLKESITSGYDEIFAEQSGSSSVNVDLKKLNTRQLIETGVRYIDRMGYCTSCKNSLFYSYRAENGNTGRHAAIAALKSTK